MAADQPTLSAERLRRRGNRIAALFVAFALVLLGVGAWLLATSQANDREQLRERYAIAADIAGDTINSLFDAAIGPALPRYAEQFGGEVTTEQLDAYIEQTQGLWSAVLEPDGTVIAESTGTPDQPGAPILDSFDEDTFFVLGDIEGSGKEQFIQTGVLFPIGEEESRVLASGSDLEVIGPFLAGSVSTLTRFGGDAYVLDGNGEILGAVSADNPEQAPPPDPELVEKAKTQEEGFYEGANGERFFAARPVTGTDWHVATSVSTTELYEPASGVSRWLPWVVLGILALALVMIGVLVRRAVDAGARLAVVNSQLESSQDRLRDRAIELQSSNAELQRSNAELEQFAYVASHDLSAPLRAVAGFSQLLGVRYKGRLDSDADEFIGHMQDGVERMQRIIDDLLAYSRVGRGGLRAEPVDLDAILDEVLHSLGPEIEERGAVVTRDELGTAYGEAGQLSQVIQNLVANGMKFTAEGVRPEVHVSAVREGGRVKVSVRDNGIGIEPSHAEQIFKMFQRLHSAEEFEGTGIGLAIAKKIVERHEGTIVIAPAPGGGTVFTFDVPAAGGGAR